MSYRVEDLPTRISEKVAVQENGCWHWTAYVGPKGYGFVKWNGGTHRVHRAVYRLLVGEVPDGLDLDHQCHNRDDECAGGPPCLHRRCVNPEHIEPATSKVNTLRGKSVPAEYARRTRCDRCGGDFVARANGARRCPACDTESSREWVSENPEAHAEYHARYRADHRDEKSEYNRRYYQENREVLLARERARYHARKAATK